jgi:hypothetical protein
MLLQESQIQVHFCMEAMTMKKILLTSLVLLAGIGCGGADGLVATPSCYELAQAPGISQPCVYSAPAEADCYALRSVRVDGEPMAQGTYNIQCYSSGSSLIWLHPSVQEHCSTWVVTACSE